MGNEKKLEILLFYPHKLEDKQSGGFFCSKFRQTALGALTYSSSLPLEMKRNHTHQMQISTPRNAKSFINCPLRGGEEWKKAKIKSHMQTQLEKATHKYNFGMGAGRG